MLKELYEIHSISIFVRIIDRLGLLIKDVIIDINSEKNESFKNNNLHYDNGMILNAKKQVKKFDLELLKEFGSKYDKIFKADFKNMNNKEFIEWLDEFLWIYQELLEEQLFKYQKSVELRKSKSLTRILPSELKDMVKEFNIFVSLVRKSLNVIPNKNLFKIFKGNDIKRIESKDYDLSDLANNMKEPILLESGITEVLK